MDNNHVRIRKVHLQTFLDILTDLFDKGVDYVDIIGTLDDDQDSIGISFSKEYMAEEYMENFDNIPVKEKIDVKLSDDDLNQLL
jgi:hypothetical protein